MEISIQWIQENPFILFLIVVIVFLVIMIYGGSNRSQDMMERFLETLSGLLEAAGEALIDITNTTLGLLEMWADFFEVLQYILFGNFHSHIRFIVANYTILFASIVSFVTTLFGLCRILNWGLALILSFTIQTALVLTSLSCAQNFSKKLPKCKKIVRYTISGKKGIPYQTDPEYGKGDWKSGFIYLVFFLPLIFLSSSLTYVYIYGEKLGDYVLYKTAYVVMTEIEQDADQNQAQIDQYFYSIKEVMSAFQRYLGEEQNRGNDINQLVAYLEGTDGTKEESQQRLADFEKYLGELKAENSSVNAKNSDANTENSDANTENSDANAKNSDANAKNSDANAENSDINRKAFQIADELLFGDSAEGLQIQIELPQILLLAENAVLLKLYDSSQLKNMNPKLDELRTYLADHALSMENFFETEKRENGNGKDSKSSNTQSKADNGNNGNKEDFDNQRIRELVRELILETQELYRQIPELHDISVWDTAPNQTKSTGQRVRMLWKNPVKSSFAAKYNRYLEITDSRLTLVSRAFGALTGIRNLFLKFIYGLCYSADVIIFLVCFVRSSQKPGKSIRMRRNLVYSVFIQPKQEKEQIKRKKDKKTGKRRMQENEDGLENRSEPEDQTENNRQKEYKSPINHWDERNVLHCLLNSHALDLLKFCEIRNLHRSVEVYQILDFANGPESRLSSKCGEKLLSKQEDNRDEWYVSEDHVRSADFYQEMLLLHSAGLAYPVKELSDGVTGYVLTTGCIHNLLQILFDTARRRGVDVRVFKEDLKEYEEDTWED